MTKQEANFIGSMNMCDEISNEAYKKIMCNCEVLEQQPCEDCISRLIVQEEITKSIALKENPHQIYKRIQAVPSVTPTRPHGKWIKRTLENMTDPFEGTRIIECSRCRIARKEYDIDMKFMNYCPNCGAEMEGYQDDR